MQLYRIEYIKLKPMLVLARTHDDAANILAHAFMQGMSNRPDADFHVVTWHPAKTGAPDILRGWKKKGYRGIVWNVDDGDGWELVSTSLEDPKKEQHDIT